MCTRGRQGTLTQHSCKLWKADTSLYLQHPAAAAVSSVINSSGNAEESSSFVLATRPRLVPVCILPRVGVDLSFTSTSDDLRLHATVQHLVQIQIRPCFQLLLRVYLLGPPKIVWKVVD